MLDKRLYALGLLCLYVSVFYCHLVAGYFIIYVFRVCFIAILFIFKALCDLLIHERC